MVSQLKVNEIITQSGSTLSLGQSGDTLSVTTGALQSNVLYPAWSVELSANQTISSGSSTKIQLNNSIFDTDSGLDTTTNYRYTVPSGKGGKYIVNFSSRTDLAIDTDAKTLIKVNGNSQYNSFQGSVKPNATGSIHFCGSCILNLSAADYIELYLLQNSGSAQLAYANYCAMSGFRIGT